MWLSAKVNCLATAPFREFMSEVREFFQSIFQRIQSKIRATDCDDCAPNSLRDQSRDLKEEKKSREVPALLGKSMQASAFPSKSFGFFLQFFFS